MSGFGNSPFGSAPPSTPFGGQQQSSQGFGSSSGGGGFGAPSTNQFGGFGTPAFGGAPAPAGSTGFGSAPTTTGFGSSSPFGGTAAPASGFGGGFGGGGGGFGATNQPPNNNNAGASNSFGSGSGFGSSGLSSSSSFQFGSSNSSTTFGGTGSFGSNNPPQQQQPSVFGGNNNSSTMTPGTTFGTAVPSSFVQPSFPQTTGGFGTTSFAGNTFGSSPAPAPSFGSTSSFGPNNHNSSNNPFGALPTTSSTPISFGTSANVIPTETMQDDSGHAGFNTSGFGGGGGGFQSNPSSASGSGPFGQSSFPPFQNSSGFGGFSSTTTTTTTIGTPAHAHDMGVGNIKDIGMTPAASATGPFGSSQNSNFGQSPPFGQSQQQQPQQGQFGAPSDMKDSSMSPTPDVSNKQDELSRIRAKLEAKKKKLEEAKKRKGQSAANSPLPSPPSSPKPAVGLALKADSATRGQLPDDLPVKATTVSSGDKEQMDLKEAVALVGTCQFMCPDDELVRRQKESDIQLLELVHPEIHPQGWNLRNTAVKRFRRSAADYKLDVPEWVRPPDVLERVCGYLEEWVQERDRQGTDPRFGQAPASLDVYQFIWDRTRMVRKDFILQNYVGTGGKCDARAVRCHERIARWHAMCEHQLSHIPDFVKMQSQQNIAELGQTMKTLNQFYDDMLRRSTVEVPDKDGKETRLKLDGYNHGCESDTIIGVNPVDYNGNQLQNDGASKGKRLIGAHAVGTPGRGTAEPEMRALYILLTIDNDGGMEVLKFAADLSRNSPEIYHSRPVQLALEVFKAKHDFNYSKFFAILRAPSTPYLFACLMFKYVEEMRKAALRTMNATYGYKRRDTFAYDQYPLKNLVRLLCFEDLDEARETCQHYNIMVNPNEEFPSSSSPTGKKIVESILWRRSKFQIPRDEAKNIALSLKPRKMIRTIESKLGGATRLAVCRGELSGDGAALLISAQSSQESREELARKLQEQTQAQLARAAEEERLKRRLLDERRRKEEEQRRLQEQRKREQEEKQRQEELEKMRRAEAQRRALEEEKRLEGELARQRAAEEQRRLQQAEEKMRREAAERRAAEEARRQAEEEAKQRRAAEAAAAEKKRKEAEEAARQRAAAEERRKKWERAEKERRRQEALQKQKEAEERARREEEERLRKEEEDRLLRLHEEEQRRIEEARKAKEEAERREELMWQEKERKARKLLLWRRLRKRLAPNLQEAISTATLEGIDLSFTETKLLVDPVVDEEMEVSSEVELGEGELDVGDFFSALAKTGSPISVARQFHETIGRSQVQLGNRNDLINADYNAVALFKLAVLIPKFKGVEFSRVHDSLQEWVGSRLQRGKVSFESRSDIELRGVAGTCKPSTCFGTDGALFIIPPFVPGAAYSLEAVTKSLCLADESVPVIVVNLDEGSNQDYARFVEEVIEAASPEGLVTVAGDEVDDYNNTLDNACRGAIESFVQGGNANGIVGVPVMALTVRCLQEALWCDGKWLGQEEVLGRARGTLQSLTAELNDLAKNFGKTQWSSWPAPEFFVDGVVPRYFQSGKNLPAFWYESLEQTVVKEEVTKIGNWLKGNLTQAVELLLREAPAGALDDCKSMMVSRQSQRAFDFAISCYNNDAGDKSAMLYLPFGMSNEVVRGVLRRLNLKSDLLDVKAPPDVVVVSVDDEGDLEGQKQGSGVLPKASAKSLPTSNKKKGKEKGSALLDPPQVPDEEKVPSPVRTPATKQFVRPTGNGGNDTTRKRHRDDEDSELVRKSKRFTARLEALVRGEPALDMVIGNTTLRHLLRKASPIKLS